LPIVPILLPLFLSAEDKAAEPMVLFNIPEGWFSIMAPLLSFFSSLLECLLKPDATKTVNGTVIRAAHPAQPHKAGVFPAGRLQLTAAVDITYIAIYQTFKSICGR